MAESIRWLHLTDLHVGKDDRDWLWPRMRAQFREDLKRVYKTAGPWDLVLFTGDLVQTGTEYPQLDDVLNDIWRWFAELGCEPRLVAVPGNHDLRRRDPKDPVVRMLRRWPTDSDVREQFLTQPHGKYRQLVKDAFRDYETWWNGTPLRPESIHHGLLPGDFSCTFNKDGYRLGLVGLNTAFLQLTETGDAEGYKGRLALHPRQLHLACGGDGISWTESHHACFLMTHHPPEWLDEASRAHLQADIMDNFCLHLCGHNHGNAPLQLTSHGAAEHVLLSWAGHSLFGLEKAANGNLDRSHGYSVGELRFVGKGHGQLRFLPRRRSLQGAIWSLVPDHQSVSLTNRSCTRAFSIRLRPAAATRTDTPRRATPKEVVADVLAASRRRCCLCYYLNNDATEKRGQIAHLDRDRSNASPDNLAFLCLEHHDQFDSLVIGAKSLTISEVKKARDILYQALDSGLLLSDPRRPVRVFIAHASADKKPVRELSQRLRAEGFAPWLDEEALLPGQEWRAQIARAIREAHVILFCLSHHTTARTGFVQNEIRLAIETAREKSVETTFIIPVRFSDCPLPPQLQQYQAVDLYDEGGWPRLKQALVHLTHQLSLGTSLISAKYNLERIRTFLLDTFSTEELRLLVYDLPTLRHLYDEFRVQTSRTAIVDMLLTRLNESSQVDSLLAWAERHRPESFHAQGSFIKLGASSPHFTKPGPLDNPYVVGNPVRADSANVFLGRFDVATSIASEVQVGVQKSSILLYGRRRMGKTSTLLNLPHLLRDHKLIHVYVSAQSARWHSDSDFSYYLTEAILRALAAAGVPTARFERRRFCSKKAFTTAPLTRLSDFFEIADDVLQGHGFQCVVAIDEYEELDAHVRTDTRDSGKGAHLTRQLLLELRDTMQHRPRFLFVFSGTHYMRELSAIDWSTIFINVKTLHLSFLQARDGVALLTQPVPDLRYEDSELVDHIVHLTGCQPFLLQAVASEIINILNLRGEKTATPALVTSAVDQVLQKQGAYFGFLWNNECSLPAHRDLLCHVASSSSPVPEEQLRCWHDALRDLTYREVLVQHDSNVTLAMPMVGMWLRANRHIL